MKLKSVLLTSLATTGLLALGTTAANADTVIVKAGDTISAIAQTHKTSVSAIQKANNLKNINLIYVGDKLEVNGKTTTQTTVTAQLPTSTTATTSAASSSATSTASAATSSSTSATSQSSESSSTATSSSSTASAASSSATSSSTTSQASASSATSESSTAASSSSTATSASTTDLTASTASTSSASMTDTASTTTDSSSTTTTSTSSTTSTTTSSSSEEAAKAWIANKESGGSYTASNGNYYGKYQLTKSLLNGDYSASNQEAVATAYVTSRYGSWTAAQTFWAANGYY